MAARLRRGHRGDDFTRAEFFRITSADLVAVDGISASMAMAILEVAYHDIGAQGYEAAQRERELAALRRKAAKLGFELTPKATPSQG
ncbi:MAG: hypothetical protein N2508_01645 [Anaerolineae bacterium]|nr:hypothetical protein [Anaerolineae bacterium]